MDKTQKVTRVKLNLDQENDFLLLGLVSSEPDYKVSLSLNKKFRITLKNISPVKITAEKKSELAFSRFSNLNSDSSLKFQLVSNRSGKYFLIEKLKNVDYLLQIPDPDNEFNLNDFISLLRNTGLITAVFNIDIDTIKDKNLHYLTQ